MTMLVSAIVTTYKREPETVLRAVRSILNQTYKNIEVIVVDDSPATYEQRDQVKAALENFGDRVNYIQHAVNQGACAARNTGLAAAHGAYVAYLDDDDEWIETKIERQLAGFDAENVAMVYCGARVWSEKQQCYYNRSERTYSGKVYEKLILENFIGSTSFPLISKAYLEEVGGFDPLMKSAQDYDVWLRLAEKYEVRYVEDILVTYYLHEGERISSNYNNRIQGQIRLHEKTKVI